MPGEFVFPKRSIHLDFHTGPAIPDVGRDFNATQFAQTFKDAHVDTVTLFAKCHHGHLYYKTKSPARHPGLKPGLDLLAEQIDALHRVGIRAPIYLSVQCDEYAANTHPEWIALTPTLQHVKWKSSAFEAGWQIMDMSSPFQDYMADQLAEVLKKFAPVDGIFLDMCWDQPSCSKWAIDGMKKKGYDPRLEADRNKYARELAMHYMARYHAMVEESHRNHPPVGIWFNSRPKTNLAQEKQFLRHVDIEALPTGGWGYAYFPYVSRYVRPFGLPTQSLTGRFFKSWGDNTSLKPPMALKYECCQILSQGMTAGVGDLLHPRGVPGKPVYDLIGKVYEHIEACEPYVAGGEILSQIAVIVDPELGDTPGPAGFGAVRALQQLRHQFDVVPPTTDLSKYELAIVLETTRIDAQLKSKLQAYIKAGGALIVCGRAALDDAGQPVMPELGIIKHAEDFADPVFLHANELVAKNLPDYDHVMYDKSLGITPADGARALVQITTPYFPRTYDRFSGHEYTPPDCISKYAAAVQNGRVITFAVPIIEAYGKHAAPTYRTILGNCIDLLMPKPLLRDNGPSKLETSIVRKGATTIVHLISFCPERRAENLDIVEDPLPLVNMSLSVKLDRAPKRAFLAPSKQTLPLEYKDGYAHTTVTVLDGHAMVVFE